MAYATLADLETNFGTVEINQLTDRDGNGINDSGVADKELDNATSTIDTYLANKYTTPITNISDYLNKVTCDIARFYLHKDRATEQVTKNYSNAIAWLKDIAIGKAVLTDNTGVPIVASGGAGGTVEYYASPEMFADDNLKQFIC